MENQKFVKLSSLVGDTFTVEGCAPFIFKKWDNDAKKMLTSMDYQEGYRKIYPVSTDKGILDMGPGQLGNLLEAVFSGGESNLIGQTFLVKSNGKSGMDIRYMFRAVSKPKPTEEEPLPEEPIW